MDNFMEYGWEDEIVNEGGDFVLLPEGDYDFTVAKYERARHEGSAKVPPCNMAKVTFTIWGAEDSVEITENFFLCNKFEWKLSALFLALGLKKHGEPLKMNVYVDNYKNKDDEKRQCNKIKKLYAYDENVTTVQPVQRQTPQYSQPAQTGGWKAGAF